MLNNFTCISPLNILKISQCTIKNSSSFPKIYFIHYYSNTVMRIIFLLVVCLIFGMKN